MVSKKNKRNKLDSLDGELRRSVLYRRPPRRQRELLETYKEGNITTYVYRELEKNAKTWTIVDALLKVIAQLLLDLKLKK